MIDAVPAARRRDEVPVWRLFGERGQTAILKARSERDADWPPTGPRATDQAALFANEAAALEFLSQRGSSVTPKFFGADPVLGVILMEDLGDGPDVASVLLGSDNGPALDAVCAWADALGDLHAVSYGHATDYAAFRGSRQPPGEVFDITGVAEQIQSAIRLSYDPSFAVPPALPGLVSAIHRELTSPGWQVLSPHDCCPDNNVVLGDGSVRLFDFEYAGLRHALVDLAYLHTVMPTCWCVRKLPSGVARLASERYRRRAARAVLSVRDDVRFWRALRMAQAGLALRALNRLLRFAADPGGGERREMDAYGFRMLSAQQLVLLRLEDLERLAGEEPQLDVLGGLAASIRAVVADRYGPLDPVPLYPAFGGER